MVSYGKFNAEQQLLKKYASKTNSLREIKERILCFYGNGLPQSDSIKTKNDRKNLNYKDEDFNKSN